MSQLYINLPVIDLTRATHFYEALGFIKNISFSNEYASGMVYDKNLTVMLLTHDFMTSFLPIHKSIADSHTTCQVLNALQLDSKEAVDSFFGQAIAAWAKATIPAYDHGFMYGKDFEDGDGHIWEVFWVSDASDISQQDNAKTT